MATLSPYDRAHLPDILAGEGDWLSARVLRLAAHCDELNLARLKVAFPQHVEAYLAFREGREASTATVREGTTAHVDLPLEAIIWSLSGDPEPATRLLAVFYIGETPHHLEAIQVHDVDIDGTIVQYAVEDGLESLLAGAREICGDWEFSTTEIEGRDYVIVMTPFSR